MIVSEEIGSHQGAGKIRKQIPGIISTSEWSMALMPFIKGSHYAEKADGEHRDLVPIRGIDRAAPVEPRGAEKASDAKVAEMEDLVDVIDRVNLVRPWSGRKEPKKESPAHQCAEPDPRMPGRTDHALNSELAHFILKALRQPLFHHGLVIEKP